MAHGQALWNTAPKYLDADERIEEILLARRAPSAVTLLVNLWLYVLGGRWYAIVVTDRTVTVLKCGHLRTTPQRVEARYPRDPRGSITARLGDILELNGRYLIRRRVPPPSSASTR